VGQLSAQINNVGLKFKKSFSTSDIKDFFV